MYNLIKNFSSSFLIEKRGIEILKKHNYYISPEVSLPGEAFKYFIHVYEFGRSRKRKKKTWIKYIAKLGNKWYPVESLTEFLINEIGKELGFKMSSSKLYLIKGYLFFCSEYFLDDEEDLIHGADILSEYLNENLEYIDKIDKEGYSQELLTFQEIEKAIKYKFSYLNKDEMINSIMKEFVNMLLFDILLGNNDRHFYNWGIIVNRFDHNEVEFAPIYDSARGLFWNFSDQKLKKCKISIYADETKPKIGWENINRTINHFDLLELLLKNNLIEKKCVALYAEKLTNTAEKILKKDVFSNFSEERKYLIIEYLKYRSDKIKDICLQV